MKKKQRNEKGFTLMELLTVIAIIGILAATITMSLSGQRKRAKLTSAMETGRSVMPVAVECYLTNKTFSTWTNTSTGGGVICAGTTAIWPSLGTTGCVYANLDDTNKRWRISCDSGATFVSCFAKDGGNCCQSNDSYVCN